MHILGVVGTGGGILLAVPMPEWQSYWLLTMATGSILLLWEVWRDWRWLIQLKGVLTIAKLLLVACALPFATVQQELFIAALMLSVLVSHGPAGLRHYSIWHGKTLESKREIKG